MISVPSTDPNSATPPMAPPCSPSPCPRRFPRDGNGARSIKTTFGWVTAPTLTWREKRAARRVSFGGFDF